MAVKDENVVEEEEVVVVSYCRQSSLHSLQNFLKGGDGGDCGGDDDHRRDGSGYSPHLKMTLRKVACKSPKQPNEDV